MKKLISASAVLLTLLLTLSATYFIGERDENLPPAVNVKLNEQKTGGYTVGVYDGKVAVFDEKGEVTHVYDVLISTLPEYDQAQLSVGVRVDSEEKLRSLIEDYTS